MNKQTSIQKRNSKIVKVIEIEFYSIDWRAKFTFFHFVDLMAKIK